MRRSGPLARKKPLRQASALRRQSALSRQAMKPKPSKRTSEEATARALLRARSNSICELCGRAPATDAHHRRNRSQGGAWAIENLLHLCHIEHMQITVNPAIAYARGWSVRSTDTATDLPALLAGGWFLLDVDGGMTQVDEADALLALAG